MRTRKQPGVAAGGSLIIRDGRKEGWLCFRRPVQVLGAPSSAEVVPLLEKLQEACGQGLWAAGFLAYEAAPGLDPCLHTRAPGPLPTAWFGLYERVERLADLPPAGPAEIPKWEPSIPAERYAATVDRIRTYIAAGDTYQVNFSYRLRAGFRGDPWALFTTLLGYDPPPHAAYADIGRFTVCSLSPELFFERDGDRVTSRPMKGTCPRGLGHEDDVRGERWLRDSAKDRAENLMIVDMARNDLGRVARPGSVEVPRLFTVERFPTVFQMTSTVTASTDADTTELLRVLFPAASITGAPKARTMEIIAELEDSPRGVYTGAVGYMGPGRQARFNVAIRTAVVDRDLATAEYGVGGGIVWDSTSGGEWDECGTKALAVSGPMPRFDLLETLRWGADEGFVLLEQHLDRVTGSAAYFGYPVERDALAGELATAARGWSGRDRRVRLLVGADGEVRIESAPVGAPADAPCRLALCPDPVDSNDRFLYHKTTHRVVYDRALSACPGCDDVLLRNRRGELTESCLANLVVELEGTLCTPPVACGLLAGTYRRRMLDEGRVEERVVRVDDLPRCTKILLVNSVRGEREAVLQP